MLCVVHVFTQVQYIIWSELIHFFESFVTSKHNLLTIFKAGYFLIAKASPEWRLNPGVGTQTKVSLSPE